MTGLGRAGLRHVAVLRELVPGIRVVGVRRPGGRPVPECDRTVHDLDDALAEGPDLAVVAGPAHTHVPIVRALIRAGIPTLVEKPLSHVTAGVAELLDEQRRLAVPVLVGYNLRHSLVVQQIQAALHRGDVGRLQVVRADVGQDLAGWRPGQDPRESVSARAETGGGALLELSHEIDLALWLAGPAVGVSAQTARLGPHAVDVEDLADLLIEHENGVRSSVHLDLLARPARRSLVLAGDEGTLVADLITGVLRTGHGDRWSVQTTEAGAASTYRRQMESFLSAVALSSPPEPGLGQARAVLELALAARLSAETGERRQLAGPKHNGRTRA